MPSRQPLPRVTLCCVDTRHPDQAWFAISRCMAAFSFGEIIFFCPQGWSHPDAEQRGIKLIPVSPLKCIEDYNRFMLSDLREHVQTSHVLVMQWDGFVSEPALWSPEFLDWDYIGAPWYHGGSPGMVGNGGFSLRSRRLLDALAHVPHDTHEPEDMTICVTLRSVLESTHNIRFAPLKLAQQFACEYGPYRTAFGFHGMHNFGHVMTPVELKVWLDDAPPEILASKPARKLIKSLIQSHRRTEALDLIRRRSQIVGWNSDQCLLVARALLPRKKSVHA